MDLQVSNICQLPFFAHSRLSPYLIHQNFYYFSSDHPHLYTSICNPYIIGAKPLYFSTSVPQFSKSMIHCANCGLAICLLGVPSGSVYLVEESMVCTTTWPFMATYALCPTILTRDECSHSHGVTASSGSVRVFDPSAATHNFSHSFASGLLYGLVEGNCSSSRELAWLIEENWSKSWCKEAWGEERNVFSK